MPCASAPPRWLSIGALVAICGVAFGLRCLHLLANDHYFLVTPDSYYFHGMARLLVNGETYLYPTHGAHLPVHVFGGIIYPVAYIAKAFACLTPLSTAQTLQVAAKLLAPGLGVATTLVLYFAISRLYGRTIALLSAFAWAIAPVAVFHQAAGYLDRDCLSLLVVTGGVFLFYLLSSPQIPTGAGRLNWVAGALVVGGIEALMYVEWGFVGPVILLAIVVAFFLLQTLSNLLARVLPSVLREEYPTRMLIAFGKGALRSLPGALDRLSGRILAAVLVLNLLAAALQPTAFYLAWKHVIGILTRSTQEARTVAEVQPLGLQDLSQYGFLLIPTIIGIYICARRRNRPDILVLAWFSVLFVGGLFAVRLFLYAAPATCVLSGIGLAALLDVKGLRPSLNHVFAMLFVNLRGLVPYLRIGLGVVIIIITITSSVLFARSFASNPPVAADDEWYDALIWLKENAEPEAVIMTWWDYGYWIFDIAQRVPVADNGRHTDDADADIARVYCAFDDTEAVSIMTHYQAEYLVFSKVETRVLPRISLRVFNVAYGDGHSIPPELRESLYSRSLEDSFHSDTSLQRMYRSPGSTVVILKLF
ncbi:MAG: STT3 domain-containing protein [Dehalococcoidia bacterium]|nr:STT3 domain-containing protein [Dehalococcoidia bacterium]